MHVFELDRLEEARATAGPAFLEFLREPSLSVGLYVLRAGEEDRQSPHAEDEVYVVMAGRARFTCGEETRDVGRGDTLFVPAAERHRFHEITDELRLIVVFAPPEGSTG